MQTKFDGLSDTSSMLRLLDISEFNNVLQQLSNPSNNLSDGNMRQLLSELSGMISGIHNVIEKCNNSEQFIQNLKNQINNYTTLDGKAKDDTVKVLESLVNNFKGSSQQVAKVLSDIASVVKNNTLSMEDQVAKVQEILHSQNNDVQELQQTLENASNINSQQEAQMLQTVRQSLEATKSAVEAYSKTSNTILNNTLQAHQYAKNATDKIHQSEGFQKVLSALDSIRDGLQHSDTNTLDNSITDLSQNANNLLTQVKGLEDVQRDGNGSDLMARMAAYKGITTEAKAMQEHLGDLSKNIEQAPQFVKEAFDKSSQIFAQIQTATEQGLSSMQQELTKAIEDNYKSITNTITNDDNGSANEFYKSLRSDIRDGILQNMHSNGVAMGNSFMEGMISKEITTSPLASAINFVKTTNVLGNTNKVKQGISDFQNHSVGFEALSSQLRSGVGNFGEAKGEMTNRLKGMSEGLINAGNAMNLSSGGLKNASEADKKLFDEYCKMIDDTEEAVKQTLMALKEEHNVSGKDISAEKQQLETILKDLDNVKKKTDSAKESAGTVGNIMNDIWSGAKSAKNMFATGLGALGLGALMNPLSMIEKGIKLMDQEGDRKYKMAKLDFAMGTNPNNGRINSIAHDMADRYYKMSNGKIGFDEPLNLYSNLATQVGGHYGGSSEGAAQDMQKLTENTFAINKAFNISDSTNANFMKVFYKDMGMSADAASAALVDVAQTAQSANIPVDKYANTIASLSNSLREKGIDADQVRGAMKSLSLSGMRTEDSQDLLESFANGNLSMANDQNASAFFGMMTGQATNPFEAVNQGLADMYDMDGHVNKSWANNMGKRVLAEANFYGGIGGGAKNPAGRKLMYDSLRKRGYSQKSTSMIMDAVQKGKGAEFIGQLFEKAEDEKDGGKAKLTSAIQASETAIQQSADQLGYTTKLEAEMTMAEKQLGDSILTNLAGPLEYFREGFTTALQTLATCVEEFAQGLSNMLSAIKNPFTDESGSFSTSNALLTAGAGGAAIIGGLATKKLGGKAISTVLKNAGTPGAKLTAGMPSKLKMLAAPAAAVAGVAGVATMTGLGNPIKDMLGKLLGTILGTDSALMKLLVVNDDIHSVSTKHVSNLEEQTKKLHSFVNDATNKMNGETAKTANANDDDMSLSHAELNEAIDKMNKRNFNGMGLTDEEAEDRMFDKSQVNHIGIGDIALGGLGAGALQMGSNLWSSRGQGGSLISRAFDTEAIKANRAILGEGVDSIGKGLANGEGMFSSLLKGAGRISKVAGKTPLLSGVISIGSEALDAYQNPDRFSASEHLLRGAIKGVGSIGGTALGAALGSLAGPVGTLAGGVAGGMAGDWLADKALEALGVSDEQGIDREKQKYDDGIKKVAQYQITCDKQRADEANEVLKKHGTDLTHLSKDQLEHMDKIFQELKSLGLEDRVARIMATNQVGADNKSTQQDAEHISSTSAGETADHLETVRNKLDNGSYNDKMGGYLLQAGIYGFRDMAGRVTDTEKSNVYYTYFTHYQNQSSDEKGQAWSEIHRMLTKGYTNPGNALSEEEFNKLFYKENIAGEITRRGLTIAKDGTVGADIITGTNISDGVAAGLKLEQQNDPKTDAQNAADKLNIDIPKPSTQSNQTPPQPYSGTRPTQNGWNIREKEYLGTTMDHGEEGCVEAVTKLGQDNKFLGQELNNGVAYVPQLIADAKKENLYQQYDPNNVQRGDVIVYGDDAHVTMADGDGGYIGNSSSANQVVHSKNLEDCGTPTGIIKTGGGSVSTDGGSSSSGDDSNKSAEEIMKDRQSLLMTQAEDITKKANWKDKIATGQLIFGPSAMGNAGMGFGASMSEQREWFKRYSGMTDESAAGWGVNGAFDGKGHIAQGSGWRDKYSKFDGAERKTSNFIINDKKYSVDHNTKNDLLRSAETNIKDAAANKIASAAEATKAVAEDTQQIAKDNQKLQEEAQKKKKEEAEDKHDVKIDVIVQANLKDEEISNVFGNINQVDNKIKNLESKIANFDKHMHTITKTVHESSTDF